MAVLFYLSAQCDHGSIRLTGGPNKFEGRVELCLDGNWGQVCAVGWIGLDAKVVCRQLGHSTDNRKLIAISSGGTQIIILFLIIALPVLNYVYGGEAVPGRVNNVRCNGDEEQLVDCGLTMLTGSNSCAPAGVVCRGQKMKLLVMKV